MSRWIKVNISFVLHSSSSMFDNIDWYNCKTEEELIKKLTLHKTERWKLKKIYKALDKFKDSLLKKYKGFYKLDRSVDFKINPIFDENFKFREEGFFRQEYDSKILVILYAVLRDENNDDNHIQKEIKKLFYQSGLNIESGVALVSDSYLGSNTLIYNSMKKEIEIYRNSIYEIHHIPFMIDSEVDFNYDDSGDDTWFELNGIRYTVDEINNNKEYFKKLFNEFGIMYKFIPINY